MRMEPCVIRNLDLAPIVGLSSLDTCAPITLYIQVPIVIIGESFVVSRCSV